MYAVKHAAEKDNLIIEVMEYTDYIQLNNMLARGEIDANSYQPGPYLDSMVQDRKYEITAVAKTVIFPLGIYSTKLSEVDSLPSGAAIAIPGDPTNGSRALLLLEKLGLVKLKPGAGLRAATTDIVENPKNLRIRELDAAKVSQSLNEVQLAVINANYAIAAGLNPAKDALLLEGADSPYASVLAVQTKYKDDPAVAKLIKAYHSDEVKQYILEHFQGLVVPAW
jgi:D-methionine transport system substrate-binding protein